MTNLRTPLYDWHVAHKARMVPFGGWDMPVQYTGVVQEHHAVRTKAGLFDISHMGRLEFTGDGTLPFLERVCTNSVATMKDGQVRYSLVCNDAGGILDDVLVYRVGGFYSMVVNASNRPKIIDWFRSQPGSGGFEFNDHTPDTGMLAVQGPDAIAACAGIFDIDPSALGYYYGAPARWNGVPCFVSRTGYTGEDGIEVTIATEFVVPLADAFVERGVIPCGLGARDTLRLEAAMPLYGHELGEDIDPLSAGLGWAVKLDKGDFVGREALTRLRSENDRPRRVGLFVEGKRAARENSPVLHDGEVVGRVTSGSYSPTLEKVIAMAYVPKALTAPGTALEVDIRGQTVPAAVVSLPFYKRK